ncbi:hypothetical protein GCM10007112_11230 [Vulcanisaeta souniana JCM 11219]|uniref:Uncharacterized protein n=1 Tax=Vulcanisaeta souniana JCM 11219 TaxID=1293586 RepID=A0A830E122_9CREN|nr:hypothetical protein GCM10007112_11230 [Vulcanisaeta souniana JCM 11219]
MDELNLMPDEQIVLSFNEAIGSKKPSHRTLGIINNNYWNYFTGRLLRGDNPNNAGHLSIY